MCGVHEIKAGLRHNSRHAIRMKLAAKRVGINPAEFPPIRAFCESLECSLLGSLLVLLANFDPLLKGYCTRFGDSIWVWFLNAARGNCQAQQQHKRGEGSHHL